MTLLEYHRLHREESASWDAAQMGAAVRAQDPLFPERVAALLPSGDYKTKVAEWLPVFQQLQDLCTMWLSGTPEQRSFIRSQMNWDRAFQLGKFRAEVTRLAVEQKSVDWLRLALAAAAIGDLTIGDARDVILVVNGLLSAARKIQADWGALVREQIALAGPAMAALFQDQLRNHPE